MAIVVTGAGGFVGGTLIGRIRERGFDCIPLSRSPVGADMMGGIHVADYGDYKPAAGDMLVHLAQPRAINEGGTDADEIAEKAVALGQRVLRHDWEHALFISSAAVYGDGENYARRSDETIAPKSTYGRMKLACEQDFIAHEGTVARLSNVYGPGMAKNNVLSDILTALDRDGPVVVRTDTPVRDYIWAEDAADGILSLLTAKAMGIFNLGTGQGTSVRELAKTAIQAAGQFDRAIVSSAPSAGLSCLFLDISRTTEATAWRPQVNIAQGIATLRENNLRVNE